MGCWHSAGADNTLNDSPPTAASPLYGDTGVRVDSNSILKAIAILSGWSGSEVLRDSFAFKPKPLILVGVNDRSWNSGPYDQSPYVKLSSPSPGTEIHYTLDGSTPTKASLLYKDSLRIDSTCTMAAIATRHGWNDGEIHSEPFVLKAQPVTMGTGGSNSPPFRIGMSCPTAGVAIYYTTDGTMPTVASYRYEDSLVFDRYDFGITLSAIAVDTLHPKISPWDSVLRTFDQEFHWNPAIVYGTISDSRDGQSYRTVKIGSRTWMAENLNYRVDSSSCYGDSSANCEIYGRLYKWAAAMGLDGMYDTSLWTGTPLRQGVCPQGFHLPDDSDWTTLLATVQAIPGIAQGAVGLPLQAVQNGTWYQYQETDAFGLRFLFAGWRYPYSSSNYLGEDEFFWSTSQSGIFNDEAHYWVGQSQSEGFGTDVIAKSAGLSVRCLEN